MSTYTWNGDTGSWTDPANWTPSGYPQDSADTALIASGTATLQASTINVGDIEIGSDDPSSPAQLVLSDAVLGPDVNASVTPINPTMEQGGWASIEVDGTSTNEGRLYVVTTNNPNNVLDVRIAPGGVFDQEGTITVSASQNGDADLMIRGTTDAQSSGTTLRNGGTISVANGGNATISSDVTGIGVIELATNSSIPGVLPTSVELGGSVGSGQTIDLSQGQLTLDQPAQFLGTIENWTSTGSISLPNVIATSQTYTQTSVNGGVLQLYDADQNQIAALHLAGKYSSDDFVLPQPDGDPYITVRDAGNAGLGASTPSSPATVGQLLQDVHRLEAALTTLIADVRSLL